MRERDLPEAFVKILPAIVNHFEKTDLTDVNSLIRWLRKSTTRRSTNTMSKGVGIQLKESGDLVRVPIFLFVEPEQEFLRPGLDRWRAYQAEDVEKSQREEAERREKNAVQHRLERINESSCTNSGGSLAAWHAGGGHWRYRVMASWPCPTKRLRPSHDGYRTRRDSLTAEKQALARYPGARVTAVRKYAGY